MPCGFLTLTIMTTYTGVESLVQRALCAFLAQKGLDAKNWPSRVWEAVKLEKDIKFV